MSFLGNMAKDALSGNTNSSNNDNPNNDTNQSADTGNSWSDVGRAAKSAYETQSGDNGSAGDKKPIDYAQVGGVAKKAAAAYNAGGGKLDAQTVGKEFASGFMGKGQQQQGSSVCFWS